MTEKPRKDNRNPPGFQVWQDKKPPFKWRTRHRKTGVTVDCDKFPLYSMAYYAECQRIADAGTEIAAKPGTLGALIKKYRASPQYYDPDIGKRGRNKEAYEKLFDFLKPHDQVAVSWYTPERIMKLRDAVYKKLKWRWTNYLMTVLSELFEWGMWRGYAKSNPVKGLPALPRPKNLPDANRPWLDYERDAVMAALPEHMKLPIALMMYCGLDPTDALLLPRDEIKDGCLNTKRLKTGVAVWARLPAPLTEIMSAAPEHKASTICANSWGKTWTYNGFSTNWGRLKGKLEQEGVVQPGLTLKGLRHTVATILRESGASLDTIQLYIGHETQRMTRHYSKTADMTVSNNAAVAMLETELERRKSKSVKPE